MTREVTKPLTVDDIRAGLQARVLGRELILRAEVDSTNDAHARERSPAP